MSIMKRIMEGANYDIATHPLYPIACDLHIGDVIRTSYESGPYRIVAVNQDRDRPLVVHLVLELTIPDDRIVTGKHYWINNVQQWPDGRYTCVNGRDEIYVDHRATAQLTLF